jgi:hypothetical protein
LKAQLPSIIKQMEANKDAIIGDMKLWPIKQLKHTRILSCQLVW